MECGFFLPPYISLNSKTVDWLIGKNELPEDMIGGKMIGTDLASMFTDIKRVS